MPSFALNGPWALGAEKAFRVKVNSTGHATFTTCRKVAGSSTWQKAQRMTGFISGQTGHTVRWTGREPPVIP